MARARIPASTYRLQLGPDLTFEDARRLLPYLERLGVDTLYLSPIFASAGGGGYHVTDPTRIDPALGGWPGFDALAGDARDRGMGILLDIVPNHMKASEESPWWSDVLRRGRDSAYAGFFDIDWEAGDGKLVLPVLTEPGEREEDEHTIRLHWREGLPALNYRRFFDITDLVCLRQEDPEVFRATHELVVRLVREGKATGLRVDHVDGLRDPQGYLERLREATGVEYLLVEKILAPGERLPEAWPVEGTTGYELGTAATALLTDPGGAAACDRIAAEIGAGDAPFAEVARESRRQAMAELFPGEVDRLARRLTRLADRAGRSLDLEDVRRALVEVTAAMPVYRTYIRRAPVPTRDRRVIERAVQEARRGGAAPVEAARFLERVLLLEGEDPPAAWLEAVLDWQQLTGPVMAKGVEDTALYRHGGLISRNEVGGDPGEEPLTPERFREEMIERVRRSPGSLSATSTHDSKRGEDVRARLAVLAELPGEWERHLHRWRELIPRRVVRPPGGSAHQSPDAREDLLLLQTLIGAWPLDGKADERFLRRIQEFMVKAAREAKFHTSWLRPEEGHERALRDAVAGLLSDRRFLDDVRPLRERVARHGMLNALGQLVLKLAAPGVPDLYRGTELWYLRLVDPDNRDPVDFDLRDRMLEELEARPQEPPGWADELLESWRDGRLKLHVTREGLRLRRRLPELLSRGTFLSLGTSGERGELATAFTRQLEEAWVVAVVPRFTTRTSGGDTWPLGSSWGNTIASLPEAAPASWRNVLTGATVSTHRERAGAAFLRLAEVLEGLPVALLAGGDASEA